MNDKPTDQVNIMRVQCLNEECNCAQTFIKHSTEDTFLCKKCRKESSYFLLQDYKYYSDTRTIPNGYTGK